MNRPLPFIPTAISFSKLNVGDDGAPLNDTVGNDTVIPEFGYTDPAIEDACKEQQLLSILKMLSKDHYRVIALLLFLKELGYEFAYEDIAGIWGNRSKGGVGNVIKRMQRTLEKA